jgi:Cys-tRNA(Pro) deacylase
MFRPISERRHITGTMTMAEALKRYLEGHNVNYNLHVVNGPTMTAQDAATQLRVPLETIIKSILFIDANQAPVLAILTGDKRVAKKKLSSTIGGSKIKIASPETTKMLAGFEIGVMPPLGHEKELTTVIDRKVLEFSRVIGGSGAAKGLVEISPQDIVILTGAKVAEITE